MLDVPAGALTTLAIVAASLGYGQGALRLVRAREAQLPLAVTAGAGLALFAALAGWFVAARVFSRGAGLVLLALGIALLALSARDVRLPRRLCILPGALALASLAALVVVLRALGALNALRVNPCDDWIAYYHPPKLLLETGALDEPFGFRRLVTLGVGPLLQSYFVPIFPISSVRFADAALGGLLAWGAARALATLTAAHPAPARVEAFGLLGVVACLAIPVANASPISLPLGSTILLLWLAVPLVRGRESAREEVALALFWGACAALLTGLRTSNVAFPGLLGLAGVALAVATRDGRALRRWLVAALAFVVALAPWSLASWRSSGTPFFPLIRGNYRFPAGLLAPLSAAETVDFVASVLWGSRLFLPLLLVLLVGRARGFGGAACACMVALVGTVVATAQALTASDSSSVVRYVTPLFAASVLFLAALWLGTLAAKDGGSRTRRSASLALVALAAFAWLLLPIRLETRKSTEKGTVVVHPIPARKIWKRGKQAFEATQRMLASGVRTVELDGASHFAAVQELLDSDARIVSAVSKPFLWRFDLHVVHLLDCPGQASPPPGMPFFQGADALGAYLVDLGYTHLAFTPPPLDRCIYSTWHWQAAQRSGDFLWEQWARYILDFLRNEQQLARRGGVVYQSPEVVVVDLRRSLAARR
jgi:hypothetical protein